MAPGLRQEFVLAKLCRTRLRIGQQQLGGFQMLRLDPR
jgi:hypothetical protein